MLKYNWHTHTYRCRHAVGKDEEYVTNAIKAGIKKLGFSDHAPYPNGYVEGIRMHYEEYDDYIKSIKYLKEKYKDQIEIYIGLEAEYYEEHLETLKKYRKELDYMILGQHGFNAEREDSYFIDNDKIFKYCDLLCKGISSGLFDYIAHPDCCLWTYPRIDEKVIEVANNIADTAKEYQVPLELNCGSGIRKGKIQYEDIVRYPYPTEAFFETFAKKGCDIVVGLDIHDPNLFHTDEYLNKALAVIENLNCNVIYEYELIEKAKERKEKYNFI